MSEAHALDLEHSECEIGNLIGRLEDTRESTCRFPAFRVRDSTCRIPASRARGACPKSKGTTCSALIGVTINF